MNIFNVILFYNSTLFVLNVHLLSFSLCDYRHCGLFSLNSYFSVKLFSSFTCLLRLSALPYWGKQSAVLLTHVSLCAAVRSVRGVGEWVDGVSESLWDLIILTSKPKQ